MPDDTKAAEERLREAGWIQCKVKPREWGHLRFQGHGWFDADLAVAILDHEEAAEARGRAQGQREGREAERAAAVAWHRKEARDASGASGHFGTQSMTDGFRREGRQAAHLHAAEMIMAGKHLGAAEREGGA